MRVALADTRRSTRRRAAIVGAACLRRLGTVSVGDDNDIEFEDLLDVGWVENRVHSCFLLTDVSGPPMLEGCRSSRGEATNEIRLWLCRVARRGAGGASTTTSAPPLDRCPGHVRSTCSPLRLAAPCPALLRWTGSTATVKSGLSVVHPIHHLLARPDTCTYSVCPVWTRAVGMALMRRPSDWASDNHIFRVGCRAVAHLLRTGL